MKRYNRQILRVMPSSYSDKLSKNSRELRRRAYAIIEEGNHAVSVHVFASVLEKT